MAKNRPDRSPAHETRSAGIRVPAPVWRFLLLFSGMAVASLAVLNFDAVQANVARPLSLGVAKSAGWLIGTLGGDVSIRGDVLIIKGFSVQVIERCSALESTLLLWSGVLAFPAPWAHKLKGVVLGFLAIQALNTIRISSLLYLGAYDRNWFEWVHLYLWSAVLLFEILIVFLIWLRLMPTRRPAALVV